MAKYQFTTDAGTNIVAIVDTGSRIELVAAGNALESIRQTIGSRILELDKAKIEAEANGDRNGSIDGDLQDLMNALSRLTGRAASGEVPSADASYEMGKRMLDESAELLRSLGVKVDLAITPPPTATATTEDQPATETPETPTTQAAAYVAATRADTAPTETAPAEEAPAPGSENAQS